MREGLWWSGSPPKDGGRHERRFAVDSGRTTSTTMYPGTKKYFGSHGGGQGSISFLMFACGKEGDISAADASVSGVLGGVSHCCARSFFQAVGCGVECSLTGRVCLMENRRDCCQTRIFAVS